MTGWLSIFVSGEGVISILVIGIILETILIIVVNPDFTLDSFGKKEKNIGKEVDKYASKSLTLAAITFAGLTFLLGTFNEQYELIKDSVYVIFFGFTSFILSYKMGVWGATRRLWFSLQQRLFNYGILALLFGLLLFFSNTFQDVLYIAYGIAVLIVVLHIKEYIEDFKMYKEAK